MSYDRKGYRDPAKVAYFNSLLSCAHSIPFEVDPTSHCFIVQETIRHAAEQAFPKPKHIKRNDVIGDEAFGLICQRGRLRKMMRAAGRDIGKMINKTIIHYVLRAWACVVSCVPNPLIDMSHAYWDRCFDRCMISLSIDFLTVRTNKLFNDDVIAFVDAKNEQLDKAANDIDTCRMYEILRPIYKPSYASI